MTTFCVSNIIIDWPTTSLLLLQGCLLLLCFTLIL